MQRVVKLLREASGSLQKARSRDDVAQDTKDARDSSGAHFVTIVGGGGFLGSSIAAWLLVLGENVKVVDGNTAQAFNKISSVVDLALRKLGSFKPDWTPPDKILDRLEIFASSDLPRALSRSWLVIEAVPDNPKIKMEVFRTVANNNPEAILVSNSLTIDPAEVCKHLGLKDGAAFRLRFLHPVVFSPYVELTPTEGAEGKIERVKGWLRRHGMLTFSSTRRLRIVQEEVTTVQDCFLRRMAHGVIPGMGDGKVCEEEGDIGTQGFMKTDVCVVCLDAEPTVQSIGACYHVCMCEACALQCLQASMPRGAVLAKCPICRGAVQPAIVFD